MVETPEIQSVDRRTPVIGPEHPFQVNKIDEQWRLITEAVRRDIVAKPEVRQALIGFCTEPVSEALPDKFITLVSGVDDRIIRLSDRFAKSMGEYLTLPEIPEDQITPDISSAPSLLSPDQVLGEHPGEQNYRNLQRHIDQDTFLKGITKEERSLVTTRYAFARDIKLLALGAEILEQGKNVSPNQDEDITLPSGIKITLDSTLPYETKADLLKPDLWIKRNQLKDRVYVIEVNGKKYILKEKKTARHTDTLKDGHVDGRSSSEEFFIAKELLESAVTEGDIKLGWEKPLSFATYPDGFQFTIFDYENGLVPANNIHSLLTQNILGHRSQFEAEFQNIAHLAQRHQDSPKVKTARERWPEGKLKTIARRIGLKKDVMQSLSYEEFAPVKALRMREQADNLMSESVAKMGYQNNDANRYSYRINPIENDRIQLEILGLDFEYYTKLSPEEAAEYLNRIRKLDIEKEANVGINFLTWSDDGRYVTKMQKAGYFAMLESEGILDQN